MRSEGENAKGSPRKPYGNRPENGEQNCTYMKPNASRRSECTGYCVKRVGSQA